MIKNIKQKTLPFFELFDRFIKNSKTGRRLQPNGKRISTGTVKNYYYTRKLLQEFSDNKGFELRIRRTKGLNRKQMLIERNYWRRFYERFTNYLYTDCNYFDNYAGQNIKNVKVFFNYLNKDLLIGVGEFYKTFYVRTEQIPIITLMPEELNFLIYDRNFEAQLTKRLREVKDVFVFGCTVALRISDLMALKKSNLRIVNDTYYLIVRSKKTTTDTKIKLPVYGVEIIKKYQNRYKTLLPLFNKVDLNLYVKKLIEKAGLIAPANKLRVKNGTQKEIRQSGDREKNSYRFCDLITTHTMRRTAITTMLSLGIPELMVRKISGHSPSSKEFFRYVAFAQSYQDKEMEKMFEQLKEKKLAVDK